jgi:hypothetical protein
MMRYLAGIAMLLLLSGCYYYPYNSNYDDGYYHHRHYDRDDYNRYHDRDDYRYNRYSDNIKLRWDIDNPDNGTVVAKGYKAPSNTAADANAEELRLAGLDGNDLNGMKNDFKLAGSSGPDTDKR